MRIGVIGATGYSGLELIRMLALHPNVKEMNFYSTSSFGEDISEQFPHLNKSVSGTIQKWDVNRIILENDLLFFATPHGVSSELINQLKDTTIQIIDLSGDFRIKDPDIYKFWYKQEHACFEKTSQFTYGISELNKEEIQKSNLIANPGCYPTSVILGVAPLVKAELIEENSIIIDAKSGISGAGKGLSSTSHYMNRNDNLTAYKLYTHQHIPEIEQFLHSINQNQNYISFTPHLIPMTRGILTTIYATAKRKISSEELQEIYKSCYEGSYFVRLRDTIPSTKDVYGSNFCDIYAAYDDRTNRITIISVIDNLIKGAAGQAIQNMNLMLKIPEETGLHFTPLFP
ncbi:N-acetyl-gamma-glutamyl-phosphate reductase [Bacillus sp. EAC]|uniref:N-acetyl-gamma-glutamyl-phosphate reductase n=1 Tax=Bacillus sp. EAC TaxID=1978338 RepID=UPI000B433A13|nr:N-acetyl-gamma-glutamyl-phosphate reductase [Bacillus sp. EAC]